MFSPVTTSASKECVDLNDVLEEITLPKLLCHWGLSDDEESNEEDKEEDEATIQSEDADEESSPTEEDLDKKSLNSDEVNAPCEYVIEKKRNYISKYGKQRSLSARYQNKKRKRPNKRNCLGQKPRRRRKKQQRRPEPDVTNIMVQASINGA